MQLLTPLQVKSETVRPSYGDPITAREYVFNDGEEITVLGLESSVMVVTVDGALYDDPETVRQKNSIRGLVVDSIINAARQREAEGQVGITHRVIESFLDSPF